MGGNRKKLVSDSSGLPKYIQAYELLLNRICSGEYPVGSKLMSCRKLAELFGISYLTVNQSLQKLVQEGLIRSQPGKGYFVLNAKPPDSEGARVPCKGQKVKNVNKEGYGFFKLGTTNLDANDYIWMAPAPESNVADIRVDRLVFVRVKKRGR